MFGASTRLGPVSPAAVTVDLVILTVREETLHVLLVERGNEPYRGLPALPGGYVRDGETLDAAAARELEEETGLAAHRLHLEQLRAYGEPGRDPRGRIFTVAYLALGPELPVPSAGTDARAALWSPVGPYLDGTDELAFDHGMILRDALERARSQLEYTTVAAAFCAEPFTVADLRRVYEVVWDVPLDPSNFRRKVTKAERFLVPTGDRRMLDAGRPAALYRRGDARLLSPPLLRGA
ncbi:NUDIX hydrolase [Actinomadura rayongensis]|uniref:NUDIX domain-containing protein n=1 Tax=Actinomadura rayongensis TaxID=1429076 RepID=A0A6I4W962_9ACTN|nr:NUDIX domain-containing protein [Actinomadura rayongensis]MXQ63272.1 NUDIX domain-containing protein [Actinomadura rayongensis]